MVVILNRIIKNSTNKLDNLLVDSNGSSTSPVLPCGSKAESIYVHYGPVA